MHAGRSVTDLVTCARSGDKQAWDALVERYAPLIWSICRRNHLGRADASDVGQRVWRLVADQLAAVRANISEGLFAALKVMLHGEERSSFWNY